MLVKRPKFDLWEVHCFESTDSTGGETVVYVFTLDGRPPIVDLLRADNRHYGGTEYYGAWEYKRLLPDQAGMLELSDVAWQMAANVFFQTPGGHYLWVGHVEEAGFLWRRAGGDE